MAVKGKGRVVGCTAFTEDRVRLSHVITLVEEHERISFISLRDDNFVIFNPSEQIGNSGTSPNAGGRYGVVTYDINAGFMDIYELK